MDRMKGAIHYTSKGIQPWEAIEAWFGKEGFSSFLAGNVIKYVCRYRDKNGLDDLNKAMHCLERLIELESDHSD